MILLVYTAWAASGKSCFVSGKIPPFKSQVIMEAAAHMQIPHNMTGVNCTFHTATESRQVWHNEQRARSYFGRWEKEAPGAKSGFAFPGTSALLYVTLTQVPPTRASTHQCVCTCNCLLLVCFAGRALEGLIMRSETLEAASANTLRAQRAARPIGWANRLFIFVHIIVWAQRWYPSRMQPTGDIAKPPARLLNLTQTQVFICRRRRDFLRRRGVPWRLAKCVYAYFSASLWQQPYIITVDSSSYLASSIFHVRPQNFAIIFATAPCTWSSSGSTDIKMNRQMHFAERERSPNLFNWIFDVNNYLAKYSCWIFVMINSI